MSPVSCLESGWRQTHSGGTLLRYLSNQWAPEMDAGRDDVKTIGSLWRLSISPEIQPS